MGPLFLHMGVFDQIWAKHIEVRPVFAQFQGCRWGPIERSLANVIQIPVLCLLALVAAEMQCRHNREDKLQTVVAKRRT